MGRKAAAAVVAAALIGLAGCGGAEPGNGGTPREPAPSAGSPSATSATRTIHIEVKTGEVVAGDGRHTVKQGSRVVLEIVSDKADEVHLHGYDETADLKPGKPSRIEFTADIPGVFEIELHEAGTLLCELQVQ